MKKLIKWFKETELQILTIFTLEYMFGSLQLAVLYVSFSTSLYDRALFSISFSKQFLYIHFLFMKFDIFDIQEKEQLID